MKGSVGTGGTAALITLELFSTLILMMFCPRRLITLLEGSLCSPPPQTSLDPSEKPKGDSHQLKGRAS